MAYNPNNPNGQATAANSAPVVIASNQTAIPITAGSSVPIIQATASNLNATVVGTGTFAVQADTELPAAAALGDTVANPTAPMVGAALMAWNGSTWERVKSDGTNNDADADQPTGVLSVEAHGQIHNGTNWDRTRSIDALSGSASNNTVVGIQAVGIGPGYSHRYGTNATPLSLGTVLGSVSTIEVEGGNTMTWTLTNTPASGTFTFEGSADAVNFFAVEVFDATQDLWVSGQNITPVTGRTYHVACAGFRTVRIKTTATLSAALTHTVNVSMGQELIAGIDTGAAPHNFGYSLVRRDREFTTAQTSLAIWVPTTGKRFAVTDITISTGGTTAGIVTLYDAASGAYVANTNIGVFRGEFAPSTTSRPGITKNFVVPYVSSAINNTLFLTTSANITVYIQINGYEI